MKISRDFLKSKVARRLFGLFILAAILPIMLTALLSYSQVSKLLLENSKEQLRSVSKSYGTSILDRINNTEVALTDYASRLSRNGRQAEATGLDRYFTNLILYRDDSARPIIGDEVIALSFTASESSHLKEGKPLLSIVVNEAGSGSAYMSRLVDKTDHSKGVLLAKLNPLYVWGSRDSLSYSYEYCVLFDRDVVLSCTDILPAAASEAIFHALQAGKPTDLRWHNSSNVAFYGETWSLYLKHKYMSPAFTILAGQTEKEIYSPITYFQTIFPLSILLTILFVILLSSNNIDKILTPLQKLTQATRTLANQVFTTKVSVESDDEFRELADSFNTMATTLGRQFSSLETLAKLDRLILNAPAPGHIIEIVIQHLTTQIASSYVSITILNDINSGEATLYISDKSVATRDLLKHFILPRDQIIQLLSKKTGFCIRLGEPLADVLLPLMDTPLSCMNIFPVLYKNKLYGAINIGFQDMDNALPEDDKRQCLAMADRISVALATSEKEEQLYQQAHFDPLTLLPNRQLLKDRFTREIMHARRENQHVAILFLDLDRFKNINDTLGHSAGDILLQQAAKRLKAELRDTDTIARIGGDEFTIVLSNIASPTDAGSIARDLIKAMADPFLVNGQQNFIGASVGIAVYPTDGDDCDELMKKADTAMYRAKEMGRNTYVFFTEDMNSDAIERISLENDLHTALTNNEFVLHYQPIMDIQNNAVASCEVLLRWQRPGYERLVTPARFITIAEDTGLIDSIGTWVIQTATEQFRHWMNEGFRFERVAINVSGVQFSNPRFVENVHSALAQNKLAPHHLELEITESILIHDVRTSIKTLEHLHKSGIGLTIDDFGTGYSSLSYLRTFPADILKVDRSFILDIPHDKEATAIVRMIIELAHSIGKRVVVEGIETEEQATAIQALGTDYAQGYFFSTPLSRDDFTQFLIEHTRKRA